MPEVVLGYSACGGEEKYVDISYFKYILYLHFESKVHDNDIYLEL